MSTLQRTMIWETRTSPRWHLQLDESGGLGTRLILEHWGGGSSGPWAITLGASAMPPWITNVRIENYLLVFQVTTFDDAESSALAFAARLLPGQTFHPARRTALREHWPDAQTQEETRVETDFILPVTWRVSRRNEPRGYWAQLRGTAKDEKSAWIQATAALAACQRWTPSEAP